MNASLGYAIVTAAFPDNERGKALGILAASFAVGPLMGPVLGGFLLDILDWRAIFYARVPICIIGVVVTWIFLQYPAMASSIELSQTS